MKIKEIFQNYGTKIVCINEIETYILAPEFHKAVIADLDLHRMISCSRKDIAYFINKVETAHLSELYFAFAYHSSWQKPFAYMPIFCYQWKHQFYHVQVRNSWLCRECNHIHYGTILMPIVEQEPIFYSNTKHPYPPIPPCFQKLPCEQCGKQLPNHLIWIKSFII